MSSDAQTSSLATRPKVCGLVVSSLWSRSARRWWPLAVPLALFSVLWLDLIHQLSYQWSNNEQYAYGWFVPFLALGLFWRRWLTRPQVSGFRSHPSSFQPLSAFCFLLLLLLLPLRVIHEINQDWPLINWPYALIVVALTLYAFHLADPQSVDRGQWSVVSSPWSAFRSPWSVVSGQWSAFRSPWSVVSGPWSLPSPWARHFAFPICFILVAVPWPYRIEHGLTQGLMHGVTALTVIVLGWVDILASQHGNVIEISTGTVGINEACSGIRSFQSMLMGALFLGELYRLRWPHRLALIGSGVVVAFGLNVVRTFILTWCASDAGIELVGKWHDPAGLSIFLASFACLWLLARRLEKHCAALDQEEAPGFMPPPSRPAGRIAESGVRPSDLGLRTPHPAPRPLVPKSLSPCVPESAVSSPVVSGQWSSGPPVRSPISAFYFLLSCFSSPRLFLATAGCWAVCVLGLTELWYRAHDVKEAGVFHWAISFPETLPTFAKIELAPRITRMLGYNSCATGRWSEADGSDWSAYFFRWNTGTAQSLIRARQHRPEICLPLSGSRQLTPSQLLWIEAGRLKLPFRLSVYEINGARAYVFFCLWEDGTEPQMGMWTSPQADRIRSVLVGRRRLGQQTCELVLSGYGSAAAAEEAVRRRLPGLVRIEHRESAAAGGRGSHPTT